MTLLKIIYYILVSAFTFKYRIVSMEIGAEKKPKQILLWGVATEEGWNMIKKGIIEG